MDKKCKVIALTNQKGGVAKTTTTFNLGTGLAMNQKKVLLIDADPQGSLTISMGLKNPDDLDVTLASLLNDIVEDRMEDPTRGILHHKEGVDLIPSNIELSGMETKLINVISREFLLKNYIDTIRDRYDYILIDCMPSLGMMTINALVAADSVVIPSQPNFLSAKGLDLLLHSVGKIKRSINKELEISGIVLTMVDNRTNNARNIIGNLREGFGERIPIFQTEIPFSVRATECSNYGESIYAHDPKGKVADAYRSLTREVMNNEERIKNRSRAEFVR